MKSVFITIALLVCAVSAATYQENVINVKADGKIKVIPNIASFDISIISSHTNVDSAIVRIRPLIASTEAVFKKYGFNNNSAKITEMTVKPVYSYNSDRDPRKRELNGYEAIRKYKIVYRDMDKLSALLVEFKLSGIDDIGNIYFSRDDIDSIAHSALLRAIDKATIIAKSIAQKSNVEIGSPSIVSSEPPSGFSYENRVHIDFEFGKNENDDPVGVIARGREGPISGPQLAKLEALKELFKIDIGQIDVENSVWVTFPITKRISHKP